MAIKRVTDVAAVTAADVEEDTLLVRREARGDARLIALRNLFGGMPVLVGAGRALQKVGALVSRGPGNTGVDVAINGEDNDAGRGARVSVGANRNQIYPAPAALRLQDAAGNWFTFYVHANGAVNTTRAREVTSENAGVGRQVGTPEIFDLHDDVTTELTTLADEDRFVVSHEVGPGAPNRYVRGV